MAVSTFEEASLARYLTMFSIGELESFEPMPGGMDNSNYLVRVNRYDEINQFVLTIVENHSFDVVPFFNQVLRHLFYYGLPVAAPQQTLDGMTSTFFCGKPTFLFPHLEGGHQADTDLEHCEIIGKALAEIHSTLATQSLDRESPYSSQWMEAVMALPTAQDLADADRRLLQKVISEYEIAQELDLPRGVIHGDLLRDNVLFGNAEPGSTDAGNTELTGILDFYNACQDFLIQDVAISINDWCCSDQGDVDAKKRDALIAAYHKERELSADELEYLPHFQKFAAARKILQALSRDQRPDSVQRMLTLLHHYDAVVR
jgi:homoserine kinase type II